MDKVTKSVDTAIISDYFKMNYRPCTLEENHDLLVKSNSLVTYLAYADLTRNNTFYEKLQQAFIEALAACKTEQEQKNLATLLDEARKVGGYAVEFYNNNIKYVNQYGVNKAKQIERRRLSGSPVSTIKDNKLRTPYNEVAYRPKNPTLATLCNTFILFLGQADATRNPKHIESLDKCMFRLLFACKTEEDYNDLSFFISLFVNHGGYAMEFNQKYQPLINKNGRNKIFEMMKNDSQNRRQENNRFNSFKQEFEELDQKLVELSNASTIDTEEVEYLLRKASQLDSELFNLKSSISNDEYMKYDQGLDKAKEYLKTLYNSLSELEDMYRSF